MISRRTLLALLSAAVMTGGVPPAAAVERVPFDRAAFEAALAAGDPVLVDIYAAWCVTCRAQSKVLRALFREPAYRAYRVFVIDYDTEKEIMRSLGATQRSTLIVFRHGVERGRLVGDTREVAIRALLDGGL